MFLERIGERRDAMGSCTKLAVRWTFVPLCIDPMIMIIVILHLLSIQIDNCICYKNVD